jgi:SAM-dependent methyltransferase
MPRRIEPKEEAIAGIDKVREYAEEHKKYARLMYRALLKDVKALNISGHYLEIGVGPGFLAIMIAEDNPGIDITAVDISPDMVNLAKEYIEERKLQDRVRCVIADVNNEKAMEELGKFDLVYSAYSLHHWKDAEKSISNLWNAVRDSGMLYIYDFRRVWWLYHLPLKGGFVDSVRAAYLPNEIGVVLQKSGIDSYKIKTLFPSFLQAMIAWK